MASNKTKCKNRRGVSLLEILICIGILAIGLLGVVSLIPVGHFAVVETAKADRSVTCANAAKAQARLTDILRPENWREWTGSNATTNFFQRYEVLRQSGLIYPAFRGATVVIDPLGIASCIHNDVVTTGTGNPNIPIFFPYMTVNESDQLWRYTTVDSVTNALTGNYFQNDQPGDNVYLLYGLNDRMYRWADDVVFESREETDNRPRQIFELSDRSVAKYPDPNLPATTTPLQVSSTGNYSWFFTVTPLNDYNTIDTTATPPNIPKPIADLKSFEVSTVICYKRDLSFDTTVDVPAERVAGVDAANFAGVFGSGASDIPLTLPADTTMTVDPMEYLEVKPGQWIMLVGRIYDWRLNYNDAGDRPGYRTIGKWFRILSVDDEMDGNIRWITVTGPEWRSTPVPLDPADLMGPSDPLPLPGAIHNTRAVIVDSVIGVFTETVTTE